ncbi:MAG TPA: guanylate kinase [Spirochaetes bacterium]|nr:guanylate kinase [Spirochaetota bacterium]
MGQAKGLKGLLFIVIGPAGAGKNTLISKVLEQLDAIQFLPSYTSRPMREGESEGNPYYFIDREKFERKIRDHELVEWKFVHGNNYYGIGKDKVEGKLDSGVSLITDVEVLGAIDIIDYFPNQCVSVFVSAGSKEELVKRIKNRGSWNEKDLSKRLERYDLEMLYKDHFDHLIYNEDLDLGVQDLNHVVQFEISQIHNRMRKSPSSLHHTVIRAIVLNSRSEVLLLKEKCPFPTSNWRLFTTHVLSNETPKEALYRELHRLCPSLSEDSKELIYSLTPISEQKRFMDTHYHYEITFRLGLDLPPIESENFNVEWFSLSEAKQYLDTEDFKLIQQ